MPSSPFSWIARRSSSSSDTPDTAGHWYARPMPACSSGGRSSSRGSSWTSLLLVPRPVHGFNPNGAATTSLTERAATPRLQRGSMARRTLQRLPRRPERIPGHSPQPAPPSRHHRLHPGSDHGHPRPARQPTSRPLPRTARRRTQRSRSPHAWRSASPHLPDRLTLSFNNHAVTIHGGLRLVQRVGDRLGADRQVRARSPG